MTLSTNMKRLWGAVAILGAAVSAGWTGSMAFGRMIDAGTSRVEVVVRENTMRIDTLEQAAERIEFKLERIDRKTDQMICLQSGRPWQECLK